MKTPKIAACPYCGFPCKEGTLYGRLFVVACERGFLAEVESVLSVCSYRGPAAMTQSDALFAHNAATLRSRGAGGQ